MEMKMMMSLGKYLFPFKIRPLMDGNMSKEETKEKFEKL